MSSMKGHSASTQPTNIKLPAVVKLADDYTTRLNYAIALANDDKPDDARTHLDAYEAMLKDMGPDEEHEEGLLEHAKVLRDKL